MRKQTKIAVVASAAALLAIGASMTSMAATKGWQQEDGVWVYLDSDGERVTEEWKKSGSQYFWLDEEGEMATNKIVEDDDNWYYVGENGARVTNAWISVDNDVDEDYYWDDEEDIATLWYYFQGTGKAYTGNKSAKTIAYGSEGKTGKFFFDEDGHMLSGWQKITETDGDDAYYYLGDENEGWAYTGWQLMDMDEDEMEDVIDFDDSDDYDDQEWFYFKPSTAKMYIGSRKYIGSKWYTFDENGVMNDSWNTVTYSSATEAPSYYTESGAQATKWVYTYGPDDDDEEQDQAWFYLDSKGAAFNANGDASITVGDVQRFKDVEGYWKDDAPNCVIQDGTNTLENVVGKVISKKNYLFNGDGQMLTGVYKIASDVTLGSKTLTANEIYYFKKGDGSSEGQMQYGKQTVTFDGEDYTWYFNKSTGAAYVAAVKDGYLYGKDGFRIESEDGNSKQVITLDYNVTNYDNTSTSLANAENTSVNVIVSSTGKLTKNGNVKIDGYTYVVSDYVIDDVATVEAND